MRVVKNYADHELVTAIKDSKQLDNAIWNLYQEYAGYISSFIINNGGSQQDADDIFQETVIAFIDTVQKDKFRSEAGVKTFLVSIARNLWYKEIRKKERLDHRETVYEKAKDTEELDVSHEMADRELKKTLRDLLGKLGESCRKILTLFYYDNLSMREMVDHLNYENEQVVRNKKYKCLKELTEMVKSNPFVAGQLNNPVQ